MPKFHMLQQTLQARRSLDSATLNTYARCHRLHYSESLLAASMKLDLRMLNCFILYSVPISKILGVDYWLERNVKFSVLNGRIGYSLFRPIGWIKAVKISTLQLSH